MSCHRGKWDFWFTLQRLHIYRSSQDTVSHQQNTMNSRQPVVMLICSLWFEICYQLKKHIWISDFWFRKYHMDRSPVCWCLGRDMKSVFLGNSLTSSVGSCVTFEINSCIWEVIFELQQLINMNLVSVFNFLDNSFDFWFKSSFESCWSVLQRYT